MGALSTNIHLAEVGRALDRMEREGDQREARRIARSIDLATMACLGAWSVNFRSIEHDADHWPSRVVVLVPSGSVPFLRHRVTIAIARGSVRGVTCDCIAASYGRSCKHAGAGVFYGYSVISAYTEAALDALLLHTARSR